MNKRYIFHIHIACLYFIIISGYTLFAQNISEKIKEEYLLQKKLEHADLEKKEKTQDIEESW